MTENIAHQYRTIAAGAGWRDRADQGLVRLDGTDAFSFLHALVTADVASLADRRGVYATYLTPQGRMLGAFDILRWGSAALLVTAARDAAGLAARLDSLIFSEDVHVADVSTQWAQIDVAGGRSAAVVANMLGVPGDEIDSLEELAFVENDGALAMRRGESPLPMFRVVCPVAARTRVTAAVIDTQTVPMGDELATALRIEAGRPEWHVDMFEDTIPLEAGLLDRGISTSKGCYIGQEVVIRILHRGGGRVAKRLVMLALPQEALDVEAGTVLAAEGEVVGRVTSAAFSPIRNRVVAFGYVHRDHAEIGRTVTVGTVGVPAEVVGLAG